jgi:excisionase family DNA binding protein
MVGISSKVPNVGLYFSVIYEPKILVVESFSSVPILFPFEPEQFWEQMRIIVREEISKQNSEVASLATQFATPGLTYKPLYKIKEVCNFFQVSRPTIYDWIKEGKLRPFKIKSRVYFLHNDIQKLLQD